MIEFLFFVIISLAFVIAYRALQVNKKLDAEYHSFLLENEGLELFCYTNRELFCDVIEQEIVPTLEDSVRIVKLKGKEPHSEFEVKFISRALNELKNVGFPNVMKIVNGKFVDISMHKQIYDGINNGKRSDLPELVRLNINRIRGSGDHST
jgi:hypothetical protein